MEAKQSRLESVLLELRPCNWKELPWATHVVVQLFPFQIPPLKDTAPERRESKWALGGYVQSCSVAIERAVGFRLQNQQETQSWAQPVATGAKSQ